MMKKYSIYIPMLMLPLSNLMWSKGIFSIENIFMMLGVAFAEEVFFRGYLLSTLTKRFTCRMKKGVLITSLGFAGMHMLNFFSEVPRDYIFIQCLCAGTIGACFGLIAYREKSISICVWIHAAINITSIGTQIGVSRHQLLFFLLVAIYYAGYGIWLYKREREEEKHETLY